MKNMTEKQQMFLLVVTAFVIYAVVTLYSGYRADAERKDLEKRCTASTTAEVTNVDSREITKRTSGGRVGRR